MVQVPGGTFAFGAVEHDPAARASERPARTVTVAPFWLDRTEVTVKQYGEAVEAGAVKPPRCQVKHMKLKKFCTWGRAGMEQHPVNGVDWVSADAYCRHRGARLPSEAEFEFVLGLDARGRIYPWGDQLPPPARAGNYADRSLPAGRREGPRLERYSDGHAGTAPVARFNKNSLGLFDLSGNIWEWCDDWYSQTPGPGPRPAGAKQGGRKVLKGGNFYCIVEELRISERHHKRPNDASVFSGFRCARDAAGATP